MAPRGLITLTFRFQRRVRLFPGLRLNLSKGGVSFSAGPRGSSLTAGRRGIYGNLGLPGTGLSKRSRLGRSTPSGSSEATGQRRAKQWPVEMRWPLDASAPVVVDPATGQPLSHTLQAQVIAANRGGLVELGLARAEALQARQDAAIHVHRQLPADFDPVQALLPAVDDADRPPARLSDKPPSPWLRLIPPLYRRQRQRFEQARAAHELALRRFARERADEKARVETLVDRAGQAGADAREALLSALIEGLDFPFDTEACFDFSGNTLNLDIDLPDETDLPATEHGFNQRSLEASEKPLSARAMRMNYARHVHALAILLAGIALRSIDGLERVVLSAFRASLNPSTGREEQQCLFSIRIDRPGWRAIDPERLGELDPIDVLAPFEQHKQMSKTGMFKPVEPLPD